MLYVLGSYRPKDLKEVPEYREVVNQTTDIFKAALKEGIRTEVPKVMQQALEKDVFLFSALKTHAQLFEASRLLTHPDGSPKTLHEFEKDVLQINQTYNVNYLDAERQFALSAAQQAANWTNMEAQRYNLQYRTASDERVRKSHQSLHGITLPVTDSFWDEYYPPNGWRCRCVTVQVNKNKYPESDSKKAVQDAELATTMINANGVNKLAIFRFNPGKQKVIFPPSHPYTKLPGAKQIQNSMKQHTETKDLKSTADLNDYFKDFATQYPEYFARGFRKLESTTKRNYNGFTDMNGTVTLNIERLRLTIEGMNNIRKGIATTFEQEDALSTLHHEFWHNANIPGNLKLTSLQSSYMELANEFVSRKTLPDFFKKLGGELQNTSLFYDRQSTGYNPMVMNYDYLIEWTKSDPEIVLNEVRKYLIEGSYNSQIQGLINGIVKGSEYTLKSSDVRKLIAAAESAYTVKSYEYTLERFENLLVKKTR